MDINQHKKVNYEMKTRYNMKPWNTKLLVLSYTYIIY